MHHELPDVQAVFRKGRGTRDQIANIHWIIERAREFQKKHLLLLYWLTGWITTTCGKFWKRWEDQTTWPASWEICMQVKKQQLELDMEQQSGSKWGKEHIKAVYSDCAYLTYIQSTSWEALDWMQHKLESRLVENYQQPQICRWHHPYGRKWRTKEPLDESERGEWKHWLKTQHSEK